MTGRPDTELEPEGFHYVDGDGDTITALRKRDSQDGSVCVTTPRNGVYLDSGAARRMAHVLLRLAGDPTRPEKSTPGLATVQDLRATSSCASPPCRPQPRPGPACPPSAIATVLWSPPPMCSRRHRRHRTGAAGHGKGHRTGTRHAPPARTVRPHSDPHRKEDLK